MDDGSIQIPSTLDAVCEEARKSLQQALASGKRGLRVEAGVPSLDASSQAYEPAMMARFALEISAALTFLDGPLLLLLPGLSAVNAARELLDAGIWEKEERERLQVSPLALHGPPDDGDDAEHPAAVVIGGLTSSADDASGVEDDAMRNARAWLRLSSVSSCVSVCLNARVRLLPIELTQHDTCFALVPYVLNRQPASAPQDGETGEDAGRALLWRAFPHPWRVLLDASSTGDYTVLAELEHRPDEAALSRLLLPTVQKRKAALDSAMRALGALDDDEKTATTTAGSVGGADGVADGLVTTRAPSEDEASSSSGAALGDVDGEDESTAVALCWDDIMAAGNNAALALYQAATLLRQRALGRAVSFGKDEAAVHVLIASEMGDAVAAKVRDPSFQLTKLRGELRGACLLRPDAAGEGIATIEQLALPAASGEEERAVCAIALLRCASREASARGQTAIVVSRTPINSEPSHPAEWFSDVGFTEQCEDTPPEVATAMKQLSSTTPVWQRLRGGAASSTAASLSGGGATTASAATRATGSRCSASSSPDEEGQGQYSSLSEAVGGVHGGKYQFGVRGDAGYTGGAFAEALATSGAADETRDADAEAWPVWATERKGRSFEEGELSLQGGAGTCSITNAYRTWERYYASVLPVGAKGRFAVRPECGWLAPRGGANNACDPSKPYADRAVIEVERLEEGEATAAQQLLVRTEEEQWLFDIVG